MRLCALPIVLTVLVSFEVHGFSQQGSPAPTPSEPKRKPLPKLVWNFFNFWRNPNPISAKKNVVDPVLEEAPHIAHPEKYLDFSLPQAPRISPQAATSKSTWGSNKPAEKTYGGTLNGTTWYVSNGPTSSWGSNRSSSTSSQSQKDQRPNSGVWGTNQKSSGSVSGQPYSVQWGSSGSGGVWGSSSSKTSPSPSKQPYTIQWGKRVSSPWGANKK